jgi:heme A synthase
MFLKFISFYSLNQESHKYFQTQGRGKEQGWKGSTDFHTWNEWKKRVWSRAQNILRMILFLYLIIMRRIRKTENCNKLKRPIYVEKVEKDI